MRALRLTLVLCLLTLCASALAAAEENAFPLTVSPPEHKRMVDPQTGAELLFLSTNPGGDGSLYYEQRSWLADSSLILFTMGRENGGLTGYLTATGELVHLATANGTFSCVTAARSRNSFFGARGSKILECSLEIHASKDLAKEPSQVVAHERVIADLGPAYSGVATPLSESCDGKYLAFGSRGGSEDAAYVLIVDIQSGAVREIRRVAGNDFHGHIMFSLTNPDLLSYKGEEGAAIEVVDLRTGGTIWRQVPKPDQELATHHCWWVNDTVTFCGGFHHQPTEDADVKVANVYTGEIRILGRGSWWPGGTPSELAAQNWWHAAGHESGRWVVADNWHGDIGLFHGRTTRTYILTKGHRTYGGGRHPEVGWDRKGQQVIFSSHMLGNVDVCVATIPQQWQDEWDEQ